MVAQAQPGRLDSANSVTCTALAGSRRLGAETRPGPARAAAARPQAWPGRRRQPLEGRSEQQLCSRGGLPVGLVKQPLGTVVTYY